MKMRTLLCLLPLAAGCKVEPVPEDIAEMMNFLFAHHADEGDEDLVELGTNLHADIHTELDVYATDGWPHDEGEVRWGGEEINNLTATEIEAAGVDKELDEDAKIVGAAATVPYRHPPELVAEAITWPEKTEVLGNLEEYTVLEETDLDCFLDKSCFTYTAEIEQVAKVALAGKATQLQTWEHRWVPHPELGDLYLIRVLTPDETKFSSGTVNVKQQYQAVMIFPEGDGARRMEAFWAETKVLGGDLNENWAQGLATAQMSNGAENLDEFIDHTILGIPEE